MKKRISALVMALVLMAAVTVNAAARWSDMAYCDMGLTFPGNKTTAHCVVDLTANDSKTKIDCTVKLLREGSTVATWPLTGTGDAVLSEYFTCVSGKGYTLVVTGTCGSDKVNEYTSNTCP